MLSFWFPLVALKGNDDKLLEELRDYQTANETEPPKKKKNHTQVKKVGTPQTFFLAFIDELETQIII